MHVCIGMFVCVFQHISIVLWKNSFYFVLISTFSAIVVGVVMPQMSTEFLVHLIFITILYINTVINQKLAVNMFVCFTEKAGQNTMIKHRKSTRECSRSLQNLKAY